MNGCPTIHGIMCKHIATLPEDSEPLATLRKALCGEPLEYRWPAHPLNRSGRAEGMLIGGNLSVLYGLQGTRFALSNFCSPLSKHTKPLLLIEDICERHYHIDRMMRNLRLSGVLANLSGLIVGQFSDCEDDPSMGCTVYETIKEAVADYDYPVLFDAPIGHVERNLPLWLGVPTQLTVTTENTSVRQLLRG
jgi:muramoyltetrapeptide carboxypeptidase